MPIAVKDNVDVLDLPTSAGTPALHGSRPGRDHHAVARLRAALNTPDGKKAAQVISSQHAATLERAAQAAQRGDMGEAARLAQQLMQSPEGTQLAHKLRQIFRK